MRRGASDSGAGVSKKRRVSRWRGGLRDGKKVSIPPKQKGICRRKKRSHKWTGQELSRLSSSLLLSLSLSLSLSLWSFGLWLNLRLEEILECTSGFEPAVTAAGEPHYAFSGQIVMRRCCRHAPPAECRPVPAARVRHSASTQPFLHSSQHTGACPLPMLCLVIVFDVKPLESFT